MIPICSHECTITVIPVGTRTYASYPTPDLPTRVEEVDPEKNDPTDVEDSESEKQMDWIVVENRKRQQKRSVMIKRDAHTLDQIYLD